MDRPRRLAEGLHMAFLGLWAGALIMVGIGAPLVFITMRQLDPALPEFASYSGPHYLVAGGQVVRRLFGICDILQGIAVIAAAATLAIIARRTGVRGLTALRLLLAAALTILLAYRFIILSPDLSATLLTSWDAARSGDTERASQLRAIYNQGHQFEQRLFGATAIMVLAMLALGCWALFKQPAPYPADRV
jgi:hypothetical protein